MATKREEVPTGLAHIETIGIGGRTIQAQTVPALGKFKEELIVLGTCLAAIYEGATCNRGCHGGAHLLERLAGRSYNLGVSAYILTMRGFYDEALNLTRSIGEITNLVMLGHVDGAAIDEWVKADRRTRIREFSPAKVRKRLAAHGADVTPANEDWYIRFCESYTHPTPQMKPNNHSADGIDRAGGWFQEEGLKTTLNEVTVQLILIAMAVSKTFGFDDYDKAIHEYLGPLEAKGN